MKLMNVQNQIMDSFWADPWLEQKENSFLQQMKYILPDVSRKTISNYQGALNYVQNKSNKWL